MNLELSATLTTDLYCSPNLGTKALNLQQKNHENLAEKEQLTCKVKKILAKLFSKRFGNKILFLVALFGNGSQTTTMLVENPITDLLRKTSS